jgi:hypothetical protein
MVPSESAPQELSNEWPCHKVSTILNSFDNFCVPPLVTEVTVKSAYNNTTVIYLLGWWRPLAFHTNIDEEILHIP